MPSKEFQELLAGMTAPQPAPAEPPTLEQQRAGFDARMSAFPTPADLKVEQVSANGAACELLTMPDSDTTRAVLYLHGGGFVVGSALSHRELASRIVVASGAPALVVDYRLAPEHPFPAALDDALSAYQWLLDKGIAGDHIAVAGDSAGGGLAASVLIALRDRGLPMAGAGALMSPWTDLTNSGESFTTRADRDPMIKGREGLDGMAAGYLAGSDASNPLASPLNAELAGLPPLYITVGESEVLYDDSSRFAAKAKQAGVSVIFDPWPDMTHVWQLFAQTPEARDSSAKVGAFIKENA